MAIIREKQTRTFFTSSTKKLEWAKQFPLTLAEGRDDFRVYSTADKGYILSSSFETNSVMNEIFRIIKTDDQGNTPGCDVICFKLSFETPNVSTNEFKWAIESTIICNVHPILQLKFLQLNLTR